MEILGGPKKGNFSALVESLRECIQDNAPSDQKQNKDKFVLIDSARRNDEASNIFNMVQQTDFKDEPESTALRMAFYDRNTHLISVIEDYKQHNDYLMLKNQVQ